MAVSISLPEYSLHGYSLCDTSVSTELCFVQFSMCTVEENADTLATAIVVSTQASPFFLTQDSHIFCQHL